MSPSWMLLARTAERGRRPALEVGLGVDEEAAAAILRPRLEVDEDGRTRLHIVEEHAVAAVVGAKAAAAARGR
jgi:hypothetical protein